MALPPQSARSSLPLTTPGVHETHQAPQKDWGDLGDERLLRALCRGKAWGTIYYAGSRVSRKQATGRRMRKASLAVRLSVCPPRCGTRSPSTGGRRRPMWIREQIRPPNIPLPLRGRSAAHNLTTLCSPPTCPPSRILSPGRATRQWRGVLLPALPCPNLHALSHALFPLNPCIDPICPCCFFPKRP